MEHPYYSKIPKLPLDKNLMMLLFLLASIKGASMKVYPKALSTRVTRNHNNILYLMLNMKIFQIPFFHPLLASVISSIIIFKIQNGLVFLTKKSSSLRVLLIHLREHKFRLNFQDSIDPLCSSCQHIKTIIHHAFLHCSN